MSNYQMKEGQGSLFKNNKKHAGTPQPDYRGKAMWRGQELEIAGWIKQSKDGNTTYVSLKLSEPRQQDAFPSTSPVLQPDKPSGDLPFL